MLAQQLFFTLLLSSFVNSTSLFCMEKIKILDFDDKILRYVAKEKLKMQPYPNVQIKPVTEIEDETQQKVVSKVLKQKQIMFLAAQEIGLETPKVPVNYNATITFENTTKFVLYIQDTRLDPKKSINLEIALLKLTNRLSHFEIPVYVADTTQIVAGFGPVFRYEKGNQRLATLEGIRSQMISGIPDYEFYSKFNVLSPESEKESNSIEENSNHYHTYVVLSGKKRSDGTLALEAFLGSGASQYEAANHAQKQQEIASRPPAGQPKEIVAHSVQQSKESIRPSMTNFNNTFNAVPPQRPQGGINVSQSTTNVKKEPAFPAPKKRTDDETAKKSGSLIYGTYRKGKELLEKTRSLRNVREASKTKDL